MAALGVAEAFGPADARFRLSLLELNMLTRIPDIKSAEAALINERALAIQEKYLGPEHPDVAHSLNRLGARWRSRRRPWGREIPAFA